MIPPVFFQALRLHQAGDLLGAERAYQESLAQNPLLPEAHCNLGILLHGQADLEASAKHLNQAVALKPDLAAAWNNLGVVLRKLHRTKEAITALQRALALNRDSAGSHHNLSLAFRAEGRFEDALTHSRMATKLRPDDLEFALAFADALSDSGEWEAAVECLSRTAQAHPMQANAHRNLGVALIAANRPGRAEDSFQQVIELDPENVNGHIGLAEASLLQGKWTEGFREYEWRLQREADGRIQRSLSGNAWQGEALNGKSLLVYNEQGMGDALQFARFLPRLAGGPVSVWVQDPLAELLQPFTDGAKVVGFSRPAPSCDFHASMVSLPFLLGTRPEDSAGDIPYLSAQPKHREAWAERFGPLARPRIGICWRGNPRHHNDHNRSIRPELLRGLIDRIPASWVSLQVPFLEEDQRILPGLHQFSAAIQGFQDSAGALANLDLLISVDTAMAHLAGAMGVPAWVLLPHAPDWRWMLERSDSPWYPSLKLFRQDRRRDWAPVLASLEEAVRAFLPSPAEREGSST